MFDTNRGTCQLAEEERSDLVRFKETDGPLHCESPVCFLSLSPPLT
jgi:hypothetical protein